MATGSVKGEWQNSTPSRSETTQPIDTKFETGDYVREIYDPLCKISCKSVHWGLLGKWVKYKENFSVVYIPFFVDRPTGPAAGGFSRAMARTTRPHARVKHFREPKFEVNI